MNINELKDRAYKIACEHGWYDEEHSLIHHLMLVITELSEAVNADRIGKYAQRKMYERESVTPQLNTEEHWCYCYQTFIKDTVEDELADAAIRILSLLGKHEVKLDEELFKKETINEGLKDANQRLSQGFLLSEDVFFLSYELTHLQDKGSNLTLDTILLHLIMTAFGLNIDLFWHIEQKLKYNESRPYKHGKKY